MHRGSKGGDVDDAVQPSLELMGVPVNTFRYTTNGGAGELTYCLLSCRAVAFTVGLTVGTNNFVISLDKI